MSLFRRFVGNTTHVFSQIRVNRDMWKWFVTWLIGLSPLLALSQEFPDQVVIVTEVRAQIQSNGVSVSFTLGKGSFCYGAQLQKTLDTTEIELFQNVGEIEGVCGSQDFETTYSLFDASPFRNQTAYYRVITGDIPTHFLPISFTDYGPDQFLVYPVPFREYTTVYVSNLKNDPVTIRILDMTGGLRYVRENVRTDEFRVNRSETGSGPLLLQVWRDGELLGTRQLMAFN